ncbi:NYN domain protein [compost metagenome]
MAFTPCLQYQYAAKKNTSDIGLALDAQEALFDHRADLFCLVTSDSDIARLTGRRRQLPQTHGSRLFSDKVWPFRASGNDETYDLLDLKMESGSHWTVSLGKLQVAESA